MQNSLNSTQTIEQLFSSYKENSCVATRNELVQRHLYIADSVARRYMGRNVDYDDLYQVASLALIQAVDRFDIEKGVKFTTFATPTVMGVVKNYFRDHVRSVRMPRHASDLLRKIDKAREALYGELLHTPTPEQIAIHLQVPIESVFEALEAGERLMVASLDAKIGEDGDAQLVDLLGMEDVGFDHIDVRDLLKRGIDKLSEAERFVVTERYWKGRSQREIAQEMNVSQMYISRVEGKVIRHLRHSIL